MNTQNKALDASTVIKKLRKSISLLSESIDKSRITLRKKDNISEDVFNRLDSYDMVVAKQNQLVDTLEKLVRVDPKTTEVLKTIEKINKLSTFIRDDAKELLHGLSGLTHTNNKKDMH